MGALDDGQEWRIMGDVPRDTRRRQCQPRRSRHLDDGMRKVLNTVHAAAIAHVLQEPMFCKRQALSSGL